MGKATAAVLCVLWLLLGSTAQAEPLGIPGQPDVPPPSRDVRPVPPAAEPPAEANVEPTDLAIPVSETAPSGLDMRAPAVIGPAGQLPDEIKFDEITYEPDGTLVLKGVTLTVASLLENGGPAIVTASRARVNAKTQQIELSEGLSVAVEDVPLGVPLRLDAQAASWNPTTKQLSVEGLAVPVPLRALLGENFPSAEIAAQFASHIRVGAPDYIYVSADRVEVQQAGKDYNVVLTGVAAYPAAEATADLYVTASELTLTAKDKVTVKRPSLWVEGVKLFTWPKYSRTLGDEAGLGGVLSFDTPQVSIDSDSIEARQEVQLHLHPMHVDVEVAYAEPYNVIAHGFAYVDVWQGGQIGVQHGDIVTTDFTRRAHLRSNDMVLTARQRSDWGNVKWNLDVESGDVGTRQLFGDVLGDLTTTQRTAVSTDLELTRASLGGDWYFTSGASARHIDYGSSEFTVVGARAGLIFRSLDFNNFVLYKENDLSGIPIMPWDTVRRRELDFQARASLVPRLSHIVRGVYDFDLDEYDRLELGTVLERRGYEVGFYWDFARDQAGLELGLLTP